MSPSLQNNDLIRQNEKLKVELREAQRQLEKAKTANSERSSPDGEGKGSPDPEGDGAELSEGQLIMRLKNQGRVHSTCFPISEDTTGGGVTWLDGATRGAPGSLAATLASVVMLPISHNQCALEIPSHANQGT